MNIDEVYFNIEKLQESLPGIFSGVEIKFPFKGNSTPIGDWSDETNLGIVVTGDNIGSSGGVYFFAMPDGEVFYIGKAASIHQRVWDHVNTPGPIENGYRKFPNHKFRCKTSTSEIAAVESGQAILGVATISAPELSSLIEVYLHTVHLMQHGKLPAINKKIG